MPVSMDHSPAFLSGRRLAEIMAKVGQHEPQGLSGPAPHARSLVHNLQGVRPRIPLRVVLPVLGNAD